MKLGKRTVLIGCAILIAPAAGFLNRMMADELYAQNEVTITYLQNDGVLISDGTDKVLIDAIFSLASGWINLNAAEAAKLTNAQPPYDDVDLVLITHNHGDHYSPGPVRTHLNSNAGARLIAPPPVAANFSGPQVISVSPARGESDTLTVNGIEVEVLHLRHFDAFGNDFSRVQNFGYLVHIGGKKILHLGDVDMTVENFQNFGLASRGIDVVLIPTFNAPAHFQASHRDALNSQIQPGHVVALHLIPGLISSIEQQVHALYPGATIFTTPLQSFALSVTSVADGEHIPQQFTLAQNYPNPFNPETHIPFFLAVDATVSVTLYNLRGEVVRALVQAMPLAAGAHTITWDGRDEFGSPLSSGAYFYRLASGQRSMVKKMLLLR